jgi:hypothetical protein
MRPLRLHKRHIGRVLRSSGNIAGRRRASSRGRELRPGRCPPLWPGDLRIDGGRVAGAGADGSETRLDGTLRPDDRCGKEVCCVEHPGSGRLERGARAWDLGKAGQQLKRESGKGLFIGGVKLPQALAELGLIDEYEFVVYPSRPWANVVRGAIEATST